MIYVRKRREGPHKRRFTGDQFSPYPNFCFQDEILSIHYSTLKCRYFQVSNNCAGSVRLYAFFEPIETGMRSMFFKVKQGATASIILSRAIRKWTWNGLLNEAAVVIYAWTNLKDPSLEQIWQKTLNGSLSCA
ncbi:hypothetical protein Y032_0290g1554 [Ancylostoma ceylanicum]|uniref:Uncharacterized protein n=1 Tax=Ancylostoma ceylanicum TaxID=53326 RepID=A0A016S6G5_9BILA|nr:hypothetical protein Y032_0290g1554 [Ancylostoma ceylanicum]